MARRIEEPKMEKNKEVEVMNEVSSSGFEKCSQGKMEPQLQMPMEMFLDQLNTMGLIRNQAIYRS